MPVAELGTIEPISNPSKIETSLKHRRDSIYEWTSLEFVENVAGF